jgi:hypothetical protein
MFQENKAELLLAGDPCLQDDADYDANGSADHKKERKAMKEVAPSTVSRPTGSPTSMGSPLLGQLHGSIIV